MEAGLQTPISTFECHPGTPRCDVYGSRFHSGLCKTHLPSINVVQDEIEHVLGLEGEVKPHQERMLQPFQQNVPLDHHMLLLQSKDR